MKAKSKPNKSFKILFVLIFYLLLTSSLCYGAVNYTFQWDPNHPNDNVTTYRFYWSMTSGGFSAANMFEIPNIAGTIPGTTQTFDPANPQYTKSLPDPNPGELMPAYYFVVSAVDNDGFESDYSLEVDTAAPQITSTPTVVSSTDTNVTITWTTDKPGTSIVEYGLTSAYGLTATNTQYLTSHTVTIEGLAAATPYHFRVSSKNEQDIGPENDLNDSNPSTDYTFTTKATGQSDTTPPVIISTPMPESVSYDSATIAWTTDELSDSVVEYGLTTAYGKTKSVSTDVTSHSVTLTGLNSGTDFPGCEDGGCTFYFRVNSTDIAGNPPTYATGNPFATTDAPDTAAPVIVSAPSVTSITDTTAVVEWKTDEPANSIVEFGKTPYSRSSRLDSFVINHSVTLTLLEAGKLYYFRVGSEDEAGNGPTFSSGGTFTTLVPPDTTAPTITSPPTVTGITESTATIEWNTDESSNSQVRYSQTSETWANLDYTVNKSEMTTHHVVTLTGLDVADGATDTWYFRVGSTDAAGNGPDNKPNASNPRPADSGAALSFATLADADNTPPVIISAPTVTGITDNTATIGWATNEPSNSQVRFAKTAGYSWSTYPFVKNDTSMVTNHSVTLTGLDSSQPYHFRVGSTDINNNGPETLGFDNDNNPTLAEISFTTKVDGTPPTITLPPTVIGKTSSSATITWGTDEPSNSQVRYSKTGADTWDDYPKMKTDGTMVTTHVVTITGLDDYDNDGTAECTVSGDTACAYYFRIGSTDIENNGPTISSRVTFNVDPTEDVTPPKFSSQPAVTAKTHNTAIINWETDEPSNSEIRYVAGDNNSPWTYVDSNVESDSAVVTLHSVTLTGLSPSTSYSLQAGSTDVSGNISDPSIRVMFSTNAEPDTTAPQIVAPPTVTIKTNNTATIEWTTNEESNSIVQYDTASGEWGSYASTQSKADMVTAHTLTLTNLFGGTLYYYRAGSVDASGNGPAVSTQITFTTEPDPDIIPPQFTAPPTVTDKTHESATIAWSTDEPSNSLVRYGLDSGSGWDTFAYAEDDAEMVTSHTVTITGLLDNQLYYLQVGSTDAEGNGPEKSNIITFKTDITPDLDAPLITSPPTVTGITVAAATIEWETDEPSNSEVWYKRSDDPLVTWRDSNALVKIDNNLVTSHSVTLSDLTCENTAVGCSYYFMVGSTDAAGNTPDDPLGVGVTSNNPFSLDNFNTEIEVDEKAPRIIVSPKVTAVDAASAIIEWKTDEPSNSQVRYGLESGNWSTYTYSEEDPALVTNHSVTLTGLNDIFVQEFVGYDDEGFPIYNYSDPCNEGNCTFYYTVGSTDALGNGPGLNQDSSNPSGEDSFVTETTVDNTAPRVSEVKVAWVTNDSALIKWTTNEPANGIVRYDVTDSAWDSYAIEESDPDMLLSHSVTISNLQPSEEYFFSVGSMDAKGNGPDPVKGDPFTTDSGPDTTAPQISNVEKVALPGTTNVLISWSTDEPGNSQVRYDTKNGNSWPTYPLSESDAEMVTEHHVTLTGLDPATRYYFRVSSTDASGNNHATSDRDKNPSIEYDIVSSEAAPPSILEYPDPNSPQMDLTAKTITIAYSELNMQNALVEANYLFPPELEFKDPGNSIVLLSSAENISKYRLSFKSLPQHTIITMTVTNDVTDADDLPLTNATITINDDDGDELPDDWEVSVGLDPTSAEAADGQGKEGDKDDDGYSNYEEFVNGTNPRDVNDYPMPADYLETIPHDGAGIDDSYRVANNGSFAVLISDEKGINITPPLNVSNVAFTVDDGTNAAYTVDLRDPNVRIVELTADDDTALTKFWAVYDRSKSDYDVFPYSANVSIGVATLNNRGFFGLVTYKFKVESLLAHTTATKTLPDFSAIGTEDPDVSGVYDAGLKVNSGDLAGAKVIYNSGESIPPTFGPSAEIPTFSLANSSKVGVAMNLQPPMVFSTPVKLIIPTPGVKNTSNVRIYMYDGTEWVIGCDKNESSYKEGWYVPGSRVNRKDSVEIQVYHFSDVQAAEDIVPPKEAKESPEADTSCFIEKLTR